MWRRIRLCIAVLIGVVLIAIATAQALHAWKTQEGLDQQEGGSGSGECDCSSQVQAAATQAAVSSATRCPPGDLSCQVQQQAEVVARLQVTLAQVSATAKEALEKADRAASASVNVAKAMTAHHNARQAAASAAAAPLDGHGAAPLPAPPVSKGDIAAQAKAMSRSG